MIPLGGKHTLGAGVLQNAKRGGTMQNFFETLMRPDREEHTERSEVAQAANLLQIGEFQFLQLSYDEWFGAEMPGAIVDRLFQHYMFYDEVPHWARHYARRIMKLDASGKLDDQAPEYHRYDSDYKRRVPQAWTKFCLSSAIVILFIGGMIFLGHVVAERGGSVLPPYFEQKMISRPGTAGTPVQSKNGP